MTDASWLLYLEEIPWLIVLPLLPVFMAYRMAKKKMFAKREGQRFIDQYHKQHKEGKLLPDPRNTIFAWDLHGVVVTFTFKMAFQHLFRYPLHHSLHLGLSLLNPLLLHRLVWNMRRTEVFEEIIFDLAEQFPSFAKHADIAFDWGNCQIPIAGTVDIMNQLSALGYKHFVCSNIGERAFALLERDNPEVAAFFTASRVCVKEDGYVAKPSDKYFQSFINSYKDRTTKNIIFVDDKIKNVVGGDRNGMISLYFANAEKLKSDLVSLGIKGLH